MLNKNVINQIEKNVKIKIIFISSGLSPDGAEKMLYSIVCNLDKRIFEPCIISLKDKNIIGKQLEDAGFRVIELNIKGLLSLIVGLIRLFKFLKLNAKHSIVQTWMYHADLFGGVIAKLANIKIIFWGIRHSDLSFNRNSLSTLIVAKLSALLSYSIPRKIINCSRNSIYVHAKFGYDQSKFRHIPNGVNINKFRYRTEYENELKKELNIADGELVIGIIGRYHIQKNHNGFIEAAKRIAQSFDGKIKFIMAGNDIDYNNIPLVSKIRECDLFEKVILLGRRNDVHKLYSTFDVYVSTSWGEGFPNVVAEAMSTGLPCVVTSAGDSSELVGQTGFTVQLGNMNDLSEKVLFLLRDEFLRVELGIKARQRIVNNYNIINISSHFEQLYKHYFHNNE